jgi:hypothetical protein
MSILEEMNQIRVRNGQEPINSFGIDGFGPGSPPAPEFTLEEIEQRTAASIPTSPSPANPASRLIEEPEPDPIPSPLVALGESAPEVAPPPTFHPRLLSPLEADPNAIMVYGEHGAFRGQSVQLSESDQTKIGRIILECAHRKLKAQMAEIMKPRRARKEQPKPQPAPPPPKKRGRPPKALTTGK